MSRTTSADGKSGGPDAVSRLTQMGNRTNLMVIDATLRCLAEPGNGHLEASLEVQALARRIKQAAGDFRASLESTDD